MKKYPKHITLTEILGPSFVGALLAIAIVAQVAFDCDVLPLILLLGVFLAVFGGMAFLPEFYELRDDGLVIVNSLLRSSFRVAYDEILYIDPVGFFRRTKRDIDAVEVIVGYRPAGKKRIRTVCCHPKNAPDFVKTLRGHCPNLIPQLE